MDLTKLAIKQADFRRYLQQELISRCQKNPRYSLRAFARQLNIVPSALSDMLNGRRTITANTIERLGLALQLSFKDIERFQKHAVSKTYKSTAYQQITLDMFALISDWYHYAILELMKVKSFRPEPQWIAKALGITKSEANAAIERLQRLEFLQCDEKGWQDLSSGFSTNIEPGLTNSARKKLQKQILEQAIEALDLVPVDQRDQTSMTIAVNAGNLPFAVDKIKKFRRNLAVELERRGSPTDVYQLSISLFPVTKKQITQGEKNE